MSAALEQLERVRAMTGYKPAVEPASPIDTADLATKSRLQARLSRLREQEEVSPPPAPLMGNDLYAAFVELARHDPTYLERLAHKFEWAYPFAKARVIASCPLLLAKTIEIAIGDNGAPKSSKRDRPERASLRWTGTIQICDRSNQVSQPDWAGRIEFRSAARAKADATRHCKEGNFSAAFRDLIDEQVAEAEPDHLFGFLRANTDGQGSPHVDGFLLVGSQADFLAHQPQVVVHALKDGALYQTQLPSFSRTTSQGNALKGRFVVQCRATRKPSSWSTGVFAFERM